MATHPFIPLYVDDYDAATAHLTPAQDGVYGRLLRLCWRTPGCSLPADEAWISRKVRLTAGQWERDGKPVLQEFFKLQRGRLVQKRLKAEYENISRKKTARVAAGKRGGEAKARKEKEKPASNASFLPAHTRAFPEPYPEPVDTPPKPPEGAFDLIGQDFEKAWSAYPDSGKATTNREKSRAAFLAQLPNAGGCAPLRRSVEAFAAHVASQGQRAKAVPAFHRWLADHRWEAFLTKPAAEPAAWAGPPEVWAAIADAKSPAFANSWLSGCAWQDVPTRTLSSPSGTVITRLRQEVGAVLRDMDIELEVRAA